MSQKSTTGTAPGKIGAGGTRNPRLGIVGGGQLARMTALAAAPLGCEVVVLERTADCPAAGVAKQVITGNWNEPVALMQLAGLVDVVSLENEFVSADALEIMVRAGHRLHPGVKTLRLVQDKLVQSQTLAAALRAPAAVMVNLLGAGPGSGAPLGIERALTIPGGHVHVYGKATSSAGRKMGHVTALGASLAAAEATARQTAEAIQFGTKL